MKTTKNGEKKKHTAKETKNPTSNWTFKKSLKKSVTKHPESAGQRSHSYDPLPSG